MTRFFVEEYRKIAMNIQTYGKRLPALGGLLLELLIPLIVLAAWILLQAWLLPRLGVPT